MGSGCGSDGRAVSSDTSGLQYKSSHRNAFISNICLLFTVNSSEKTKIKIRRPGIAFHLKRRERDEEEKNEKPKIRGLRILYKIESEREAECF